MNKWKNEWRDEWDPPAGGLEWISIWLGTTAALLDIFFCRRGKCEEMWGTQRGGRRGRGYMNKNPELLLQEPLSGQRAAQLPDCSGSQEDSLGHSTMYLQLQREQWEPEACLQSQSLLLIGGAWRIVTKVRKIDKTVTRGASNCLISALKS